MPHYSASSSGVTHEGRKEPTSFEGENLATSDIDMAEKTLNCAHNNKLFSAPSPAANPAPSEQKISELSSTC